MGQGVQRSSDVGDCRHHWERIKSVSHCLSLILHILEVVLTGSQSQLCRYARSGLAVHVALVTERRYALDTPTTANFIPRASATRILTACPACFLSTHYSSKLLVIQPLPNDTCVLAFVSIILGTLFESCQCRPTRVHPGPTHISQLNAHT